MDLSEGYIRLFRQFLNWEWYDDANTMRVFIHCLLNANYTDKKWRGIDIKRGQFLTSLSKLSNELNLTKMQIRIALKKLISTHEITHAPTTQYSIITIKNYNHFQIHNTRITHGITHGITHEQHTSNKEIVSNTAIKKNFHNTRITHEITPTNNIDNSNTSYINISSSSSSIEREITKEEEEILKKFSKEKNKVKYFRPWLRKLIENGDIQEVLDKAKKWQENQEKKAVIGKQNEATEPENEEECKEAQRIAHEKVKNLRRKNRGE